MTKLRIDGSELKMLNRNPKLNISIIDSREPDKTKSTKTEMIQLPVNDNKEILGFVHDYAVDANQIHDAYLEDDLIQIKGKLQILGVDSGTFGVIKSQFLSNNFNWIEAVKTTKVNELTIPSIEHTLNTANVLAAYDGVDENYIYPLTDYGQFGTTVVSGKTIYTVVTIDRYPAVRVHTILEAIFSAAGYSITGTYIESADFSSLFLLFGKNVYISTEKAVESMQAKAGMTAHDINSLAIVASPPTTNLLLFGGANNQVVPFNNVSSDPFFDNGGNFDTANNWYTVTNPSAVAFKTNINLKLSYSETPNSITTATVQIDIIGSVSGVLASTGAVSHTFSLTAVDYLLETTTIQFSGVENISIKITIIQIAMTNTAGRGTEYVSCIINKDLSYFEIIPDRRRGELWEYTSDEMLPDITQLQFIKGLAHSKNLYFTTNENTKTVRIEQAYDFYGETGQDFSSYASRKYKMKANSIYEYFYALKDDMSDALLIDEKGVNDEYKSYRYEPSNQNKAEVKEIRNQTFAPTITRIPYRLTCTKEHPTIWSELLNNFLFPDYTPDYNFDLRIMRLVEGSTDTFSWNGIAAAAVAVPIMDMEHIDFQTDYLITNLELNEKFDLTVEMYIPPIAINNILNQVDDKDLRAPVYLDYVDFAGWYWIESIPDYDMETGKCTVKLIKTRKNAAL